MISEPDAKSHGLARYTSKNGAQKGGCIQTILGEKESRTSEKAFLLKSATYHRRPQLCGQSWV